MLNTAILERKAIKPGRFSVNLLPKTSQDFPTTPAPLTQVLAELKIKPFTPASVRAYKSQVLKDLHMSFGKLCLMGLLLVNGSMCSMSRLIAIILTVSIILAVGVSGLSYYLSNQVLQAASHEFADALDWPFASAALIFIISTCIIVNFAYTTIDYYWARVPVMKYRGDVPPSVEEEIAAIKARCPKARFLVDYLVNDPFLVVRNGRFGRCYHLCVQGEKGFVH